MNDDIEIKLKKLRESYAKNLKDKIISIEMTWKMVKKTKKQQYLDELHRMLHNLYGSSATYGFHDISQLTRQLELIMNLLLKNDPFIISIAEKEQIDLLFAKLVSTSDQITAKIDYD